jgi:hypothetical protein
VDVAMVRHVLGHNGHTEQQIVDHLAALIRSAGHLYLVDVEPRCSECDRPILTSSR